MSEQSLKLTSYFGERQRAVGEARGFLADAMLDLLGAGGVATSVMMGGTTGFGPEHELRCDRSLSLSENPPAILAAVGRVEDPLTGRRCDSDDRPRTIDARARATGHPAQRHRSTERDRQPNRRCRKAHGLRRPPGAGRRNLSRLRRLRAFVSTWIRRCHSASRRRRHGIRRALPGSLLRPQCQCSAADHRTGAARRCRRGARRIAPRGP